MSILVHTGEHTQTHTPTGGIYDLLWLLPLTKGVCVCVRSDRQGLRSTPTTALAAKFENKDIQPKHMSVKLHTLF